MFVVVGIAAAALTMAAVAVAITPLGDCPDSASDEVGTTDVYVSKITP